MGISKKTIRDMELNGKRVVMRVDFNVPIKNGAIQDDTRITAALPSIKYILDKGAKSLVLMSHLGDPKKDMKKAKEKAEKAGKPFNEEDYINGQHKMAPIGAHLAKLLGREVKVTDSCIGESVLSTVNALSNGQVVLLENTRFHKEETSESAEDREKLAKELAKYGDIYVNDAFGTAHRAHASTETLAKYLPAVAGFLMEKELEFLEEKVVKNPAKPFVAIVGGAKVSSKITVIEKLMDKVDKIIIGGGMAFTFFKAMGKEVGTSLVELDQLEVAKHTMAKAKEKNIEFILQTDAIVASAFANDANKKTVDIDQIPADMMGLDIGPKSIDLFKSALSNAKTVFWNGPVGVFEMESYAKGTVEIANSLASLSNAITVIGGGDSVSAVNKAGVSDKMSHISTGGGASMELVEGKVLPGVAALNNK
ncbi:MAG TPA: phosphoglycerate kinase [Leptospiraceae bacterium]|nr:phosphoglycerate kinase [Leptospiraceae bacterium]HMX34601.1 phosphoglycerate kinase [Leptospiraceae bacterium]HMY34148.1 phosphoglycerate kinase [Leptospiraceae bacterium]HMZ64725.1 phosphoglycerate kinase [Leptospiraceae bacterium]HNA08976.1 phosphoglycerate kinase [Leptospiraceae bacterium]